MDYAIAVRSYKRPQMFHTHTIAELRKNDLLGRVTVFVGSDDIEEYRKVEPDLVYVPVRKGGHNAIADICAYYPPYKRIFFLDDDLQGWFWYDRPADTIRYDRMGEVIERAFHASDIWSFDYTSNKSWLRQMTTDIAPRWSSITGCSFGARNVPELITTPTGHCDDLHRTVNYLNAGIVPYAFRGAGFTKTGYAVNPGGMQSSGDRDDTKSICEYLAPLCAPWISGMEKTKSGLWSLKLKHFKTLRRLFKGLHPSTPA